MGKKAQKIYATQIRLPEPLAEVIKKDAEANHRSFNAQLLFLIEKALGDAASTPKGRGGMVTAFMPGQRNPVEK